MDALTRALAQWARVKVASEAVGLIATLAALGFIVWIVVTLLRFTRAMLGV